ncbi:MAG: response regulator transcription factor [Candidatus Omnitrophica bacterium]|nr:response regulator transcription factor [Candidatus Omnitrophota bacterium]
MPSVMPKIFIVDDDDSVRKGLERLLKSLDYRVQSFACAQEFLDQASVKGVCVLILDVRMPKFSGLDLQQEMLRRNMSLPVIFITGHGDIPMSVRAIKSGAIDFLSKPFKEETLINAIEQAVVKSKGLQKEYLKYQAIRNRINVLTERELQVMKWVITGMLNKQIALKLGISEKTIKVHRGRVMQKMEVVSVAELVRLTEKVGIKPSS